MDDFFSAVLLWWLYGPALNLEIFLPNVFRLNLFLVVRISWRGSIKNPRLRRDFQLMSQLLSHA